MRSSIAPGFRRAAALLAVCAGLAGAGSTASAQAPAGTVPLPPPAAPAQSDPRTAVTAVEQATRLIAEGKRADALKVLDTALKAAPRNPQLRFLYGVILAEDGKRRDAIDVFRQLIEDYPELPEPYNNLAVMLAAEGDLDGARAALENAVRALPGYALAQENLGDVYLRLAARAYEQATKLDARNASASGKLKLTRELVDRLAPRAPAAGASSPSNAPPAAAGAASTSNAAPAAAPTSSPRN